MSAYYEEVNYTFLFYMMIAMAMIFFSIYLVAEDDDPEAAYVPFFVIGVFFVIILLFSKLVIQVEQGKLSVGFRLMKSSFRVEDIVSYEKKTTRWFHGSGAHATFKSRSYITGPGTAVEVRAKDGRSCIFSTKHPDRVCEAIRIASSMR